MKKTMVNSVIIQPALLLFVLVFLVLYHQYQEHRIIQIHYYLLLSSIVLLFFTNRSNKKSILLLTEIYHVLLFSALAIAYIFLNPEGLPRVTDIFFWVIQVILIMMGLSVTALKMWWLLNKRFK